MVSPVIRSALSTSTGDPTARIFSVWELKVTRAAWSRISR
jgi:hypothetical protein